MTASKTHTEPTVTAEGATLNSQRLKYLNVDIPEPGGFATVAPGVVWLRVPMPIDLNHINLWLLDDGDGWTLVDTGLNADLCKEAWQKFEAALFKEKPLKRIFLTHLHPDHIGLARWLQDRHSVPMWMSSRGIKLAQLYAAPQSEAEIEQAHGYMRSHGFVDTELLAKFFSGKMFRSGLSGLPDISHHPIDGDRIAIGAAEWRVYETNGHAEGHQCLSDEQNKMLISGDQVLPTISSNVSYSPRGGDMNPLDSYLTSLERLSELDQRTLVLPSHGRPFYGLQLRAADLIAHHREHLETVESACVEPKSAYDLVPLLFKRRLIGSHWMFAMSETIAHAEYLVTAERLARTVATDGAIKYVRH